MTATTKIIHFPEPQTCPPAAAHRMIQGGITMKVKHTHPTYDTPEHRQQAILDIKKICAAALRSAKEASGKQSA